MNKHFEFLITHPDDFEVADELFDSLMTPDNIKWTKVIKDDWPHYQIDSGYFSYSWEPPGIQMTFSFGFPYDVARLIADEIIVKLKRHSPDSSIDLIELN